MSPALSDETVSLSLLGRARFSYSRGPRMGGCSCMTSMHSRLDWVTWPLSFQPPPHKGGSSLVLVDASPLYSNESASTNTCLLFDHAPSNPQGKLSIAFHWLCGGNASFIEHGENDADGARRKGMWWSPRYGIYTVELAVFAHRDM